MRPGAGRPVLPAAGAASKRLPAGGELGGGRVSRGAALPAPGFVLQAGEAPRQLRAALPRARAWGARGAAAGAAASGPRSP